MLQFIAEDAMFIDFELITIGVKNYSLCIIDGIGIYNEYSVISTSRTGTSLVHTVVFRDCTQLVLEKYY